MKTTKYVFRLEKVLSRHAKDCDNIGFSVNIRFMY